MGATGYTPTIMMTIFPAIEDDIMKLKKPTKTKNAAAKSLSEKKHRPQVIPDKRRESYDRYMMRKLREVWHKGDSDGD
jgi:hypothetical protein